MIMRIYNISVGFLAGYLLFLGEMIFLSYYSFNIGNINQGLICILVLGITGLGYPLIYAKNLKHEKLEKQKSVE